MKTTIAVYDSHETAIQAVEELTKSGYPAKQLSIIGEAELKEGHMHLKSKQTVIGAGAGVGAAVGTALGVLAGAGVFAIPGFGFIFGAGALVGAFAGLDFGMLGGGLISVLTTLGIHEDVAEKYESYLRAGKFLVVAHGNDEEIKKAHALLTAYAKHEELLIHDEVAKIFQAKLQK